MAHDSHRWVMISLIFQLLNTKIQCAPSYSYKNDDLRIGELEKRLSHGYAKFQYPKEETTHGVGYGHHLHPFYYQGNSPLYSCAISGDWHPIVDHIYHYNPVHNLGKSNSIGQVENHYINPHFHHTENWRKSETTRSKTSQNYLKYFQPVILRRSDPVNKADSDISSSKYPTKSDHGEMTTPNYSAAQHNKFKIHNNTDNIAYNKYIIRSKHDEPMIPIIHSFLTANGIQPTVPNTTDSSTNNKYIIRSNKDEPMIPIIHMATQIMPTSVVTESNALPQSTRSGFLKYTSSSPQPTTTKLDASNNLQQASSSKRHYKTNPQNFVDLFTMLHIIPHSDDIDFF